MQPADAGAGTGRETAELRMLRRDLALARARQEDLERYLAEALRGGCPARHRTALPQHARGAAGSGAHLKRALDLCWQQRTSLEVRLADLRVELELAADTAAGAGARTMTAPPTPAAPPPPGGPVVRVARQAKRSGCRAAAAAAGHRCIADGGRRPTGGGRWHRAGRGPGGCRHARDLDPHHLAPTAPAAPTVPESGGMAEPLDLSTLRCRSVATSRPGTRRLGRGTGAHRGR